MSGRPRGPPPRVGAHGGIEGSQRPPPCMVRLTLRPSADAGAGCEPGPVSGAQTNRYRGQEQKAADLGHARQLGEEGEQDGGRAHGRGDAGAGQAPVLLLAGVAEHPRAARYRGAAARPRSQVPVVGIGVRFVDRPRIGRRMVGSPAAACRVAATTRRPVRRPALPPLRAGRSG